MMNIKKLESIRTLGSFSFYQKIDYFYNSMSGSTIFYQDKSIEVKERSMYVLNTILEHFFTTHDIYNKTSYKVLKTKYNNPIVINENIILISTLNIKSYENIWINYANVSRYYLINNKLKLIFYSGNMLLLDKTSDFLDKQINKITIMKTYLFNVRFYI